MKVLEEAGITDATLHEEMQSQMTRSYSVLQKVIAAKGDMSAAFVAVLGKHNGKSLLWVIIDKNIAKANGGYKASRGLIRNDKAAAKVFFKGARFASGSAQWDGEQLVLRTAGGTLTAGGLQGSLSKLARGLKSCEVSQIKALMAVLRGAVVIGEGEEVSEERSGERAVLSGLSKDELADLFGATREDAAELETFANTAGSWSADLGIDEEAAARSEAAAGLFDEFNQSNDPDEQAAIWVDLIALGPLPSEKKRPGERLTAQEWLTTNSGAISAAVRDAREIQRLLDRREVLLEKMQEMVASDEVTWEKPQVATWTALRSEVVQCGERYEALMAQVTSQVEGLRKASKEALRDGG